jgi:hypothetical protein
VNGLASQFPRFLQLAYVMLTIPVQYNNLKTKLRNALHVMTVDSALRVQDQIDASNIF